MIFFSQTLVCTVVDVASSCTLSVLVTALAETVTHRVTVTLFWQQPRNARY